MYIPTGQFKSIETITGKVGTSITSSFTNILTENAIIKDAKLFDNLSLTSSISAITFPFNIPNEFQIAITNIKNNAENTVSFKISSENIPEATSGKAAINIQLYNNNIALTENPIIYQFDYEFISNNFYISLNETNGTINIPEYQKNNELYVGGNYIVMSSGEHDDSVGVLVYCPSFYDENGVLITQSQMGEDDTGLVLR